MEGTITITAKDVGDAREDEQGTPIGTPIKFEPKRFPEGAVEGDPMDHTFMLLPWQLRDPGEGGFDAEVVARRPPREQKLPEFERLTEMLASGCSREVTHRACFILYRLLIERVP